MRLVDLTDEERAALETAQQSVRTAGVWRRYQSVPLLAERQEPAVAAQALGCSASAVYYWAEACREEGLAGLAEGPHAGRSRRLDATGEAEIARLLGEDPQAHGYAAIDWTVPLLHTELCQQGYTASEHILRRTLHRLGYRWKRPKYVLGRPDPASAAKKALVEQVSATLAAAGEVWFGDETTLREFPPLRASWAKRGQQRAVVITGRNRRQVRWSVAPSMSTTRRRSMQAEEWRAQP